MVKNSRQRWIEAGYELFAAEGVNGILVEKIARVLDLNKSGFYHYFQTPDNFLNELFNHHRNVASQMAKETEHCQTLDPDYFKVVVKYKLCTLVQAQLDWEINNVLCNTVVEEVRETLERPLIPLWCKAFDLPDDPGLAHRHFTLFKNNFFGHSNTKTIKLELLHNMMIEARDVMQEIFKYSIRYKMNANVHEMVS
jgi:AcrR family transcriptional regulator